MRRSNEPLWWAPFSAGMMLDALVMPVLILITGFLIPFGIITGDLRGLLLHPFTRFVLFVVISLTFFHAAHRLRFTLQDFGLKNAKGLLAFLCYGSAIVGTIVAALIAANVI